MSDKLTPDEFTAAFDNLNLWMADEGQTEATMVTVALVIQARATLEVAEQLRIANLIKLGALGNHILLADQPSIDAAEALTEYVDHEMGGYFQLRPDIARALQIDKETN